MKRTAIVAALAVAGCATTGAAPGAPMAGQATPAKWPAAASPAAITDPATEAAIDAILARMTDEQKVGQVIQADISAITPDDLTRYPLGSILAGGNSGPFGDERADAATWGRMVAGFRAASRASGAGIPILFGIDAVHGHSNLPGATIFPHNIGLGAARDPAMIERIGRATAVEIAASGIEWTFAPTLAVPEDLRWGRTYEGYAADPALVADYARAMTLGLQGPLVPGRPLDRTQVAATAKHFLADGGTADGRDQGDARMAEDTLIARHAAGYPAAINAGALTVMASFSSWNGIKNHGNASLLTDVLKRRMGFQGLVVGDWNGHGQVPGCAATDCADALNAGLDLYMAPDSWKGLFASTLAAVRDGRIARTRLDDAVRRNLRVKFKLGLMGPTAITRGDPAAVGAPAHLALAREAVAKSLVLLKNDGGTLPIRSGARVLVTGPGADDMAMQAGGWTISWQGTDTKAGDFPNGQTIGRAIADAVTAAGGAATLAPDDRGTPRADVAVVIMGERPYAEFEGDVTDLAFRPRAADIAMIARLKAAGTRVVVVFLSGRPMFAGPLLNQADAFVAAWLPGTQGGGVADVLVAGRNGIAPRDFVGRLPFDWPDSARVPAPVLFARGAGLSYASPRVIGRVNEDPGVDLRSRAHETAFMVRGKVAPPWRLEIDGALSQRPVDWSAQEDARRFEWLADGQFAISGAAVDLTAHRDGALAVEWRVERASNAPVTLAFGGKAVTLAPPRAGTATTLRVPLRCFAVPLSGIAQPLRIGATKGFSATIRSVGIATGPTTAPCPSAAR